MSQDEWISLSEAVVLIAEHCFPEEGNWRNTKNKARRRITTAIGNEDLHRVPNGSSWKFDRGDFLQWAARKWPDLRQHVSIPVIIQGAFAETSIGTFSASLRHTPSDPEELKSLLNKCRSELEEARTRIQRLERIEQEWIEARKKDAERRSMQREYGRRGGRPKGS